MKASKKDTELFRLERFKCFTTDFPIGRIETTEVPDFLVFGESRVIGIELTDLYRQTSGAEAEQQVSEAMRTRVLARAQQIYVARHHPAVQATLFLDDRTRIKKSEVEQLATDIANLVATHIPAANSSAQIRPDWRATWRLPKPVIELYIYRRDSVKKTFFSAVKTTWVTTLRSADIERVLMQKAPKYPDYRKRCDEAWLVINADMESMATWFEFDSTLLTEPFVTNFDRVFLMRHFEGKAYELGVAGADR